MLPEPLRHGLGRPIREQCDRLAALQIHEDGAIGVPFPQGEIVHAEDGGRGERRGRLPTEEAQQRVPAHPHVPRVADVHPSRPAERHAEGDQALGEPQGAPGPGGRDGGQPFGEDATVTRAIAAKPLADAELEAHPILRPGQVRQGASIVTMDAPCWGGAQRTGCAGLRRLHA